MNKTKSLNFMKMIKLTLILVHFPPLLITSSETNQILKRGKILVWGIQCVRLHL